MRGGIRVIAHSATLQVSRSPGAEGVGVRIERTAARRERRRGRQIMLIAAKEFGDRFRSGWVIACVLVWLGAIGLASFLGLLQIGRIGALGYERTAISVLNLVQYLVPLLALLLGHDLIVHEREDGTLRLILARGVSRTRLLLGKFIGACLTLSVPLLFGFAIAGTVVGWAANDRQIGPFLRLAVSGMVLGILFLGMGLVVSTFCRTRVQSLVVALLTWCIAVFAFDLIALGMLVSNRMPAAAQEIEVLCDATHVNGDIHSAFDSLTDDRGHAAPANGTSTLGWLAINPVDLFRAVNLSNQIDLHVPAQTIAVTVVAWLSFTLGASLWKLHRTDF